MKTLYVTDLDGTLLRSDERTSDFTNQTINELVEKGMLFSYATARSYSTASKVTRGLNARIPLIVYNGAMVVDSRNGQILLSNFFEESVKTLLDDLLQRGIYPIVYAFVNGEEKFSYLPECSGRGMLDFVATRAGDRRNRPVERIEQLYEGEIFYVTCIDEQSKLEPLHEAYREIFRAVYQRDIYSGEQWLEFMPKAASKANAIRQLMQRLNGGRLVVFGDGLNDVDMFQLANESYAVENAHPELKRVATAIIDGNNEDGVANWLKENAVCQPQHTAFEKWFEI